MDINTLLKKRDTKVQSHLEQYAPVWLDTEKTTPEDETVVFNVIFQHKDYGWINRRYHFDAFNNVLYYRGQTTVSESQIPEVQNKEPYITSLTPDIPNSYGG